jgi:hypothetical protein
MAYLKSIQMDNLIANLKVWTGLLDSQVNDSELEIERRRQRNTRALNVKADIDELIEYIKTNDMPDGAKRAIELALSWNPMSKT